MIDPFSDHEEYRTYPFLRPIEYHGDYYRVNHDTKKLEIANFDESGVTWNEAITDLPDIKYFTLKVVGKYIFITNYSDYIYAYSEDAKHWEIIFEKCIYDKNVKHPWTCEYMLDFVTVLAINDFPIAYATHSESNKYRYSFISKSTLRLLLNSRYGIDGKSILNWELLTKKRIRLKR